MKEMKYEEMKYKEILRLGEDIEERLHRLGEISHTEGVPGVWRAIHMPADLSAKSLLSEWLSEAGLSVRQDAFGNLYGRLNGETSETILVGSHVDTVKNGGLYDGACGVITAISAVKALREAGWKPYYSVEVVGIEEEEGSRFDLSYPGSNAIIGGLTQEDLEVKDENGISLRQAMEACGYDPALIPTADRRGQVKEYIELHVEQGEVLDRENISIGIVENITGMVMFSVSVRGEQNHAGATPMYLRKDPMIKAAQLMLQLTERIQEISPSGVITFGEVAVSPGVANVIPGQVDFSIDLRDGNLDALLAEEAAVKEIIRAAEEDGFTIDLQMYSHEDPVPLDPEMTASLQEAAEEAKITHKRMNSGAGHDAMIIGRVIPTAMIFIPSADGISHSPDEYTRPCDLSNGCEILGRMIVKRAGGFCEEIGKDRK